MAKREMIYNVGGEGGKSTISGFELYRFIEWVISGIAGLLITVWAFCPEEILTTKFSFLKLLFPSRYYLLAFSAWFGVTAIYGVIMVYAWGMMRCMPNDSYFTMVDRHTFLRPAPKRL